MKRYAFIYNPAARGGKSNSKIEALEQHIYQLPNTDLFRSKFKGDISGLLGQIKDEFDVFVACGGDGTVREIASQLISTDKILGIIPMGTGNDLCKTLEIPTDLKQALDIIFNGKVKKIDVGRCNDFIFLNSLGFGFDGLTNIYAYEFNQFPSFLRYTVAAFKATFHHTPFRLQIKDSNGKSHQELIMATFASGRVEGSAFWIAPEASLTDGRLNLVTIAPVSKWLIPLLLPLIVLKKLSWIPQVNSTEVEETELHFNDDVEVHADGEIIKYKDSKFAILLTPKGLKMLSRK